MLMTFPAQFDWFRGLNGLFCSMGLSAINPDKKILRIQNIDLWQACG
jgi:hypothetical protein